MPVTCAFRYRARDLVKALSPAVDGRGGGKPNLAQAGGNKAELARTLHMSRPTLYSRLDALERIVGLDLDDAESRTSLHVAMLILQKR